MAVVKVVPVQGQVIAGAGGNTLFGTQLPGLNASPVANNFWLQVITAARQFLETPVVEDMIRMRLNIYKQQAGINQDPPPIQLQKGNANAGKIAENNGGAVQGETPNAFIMKQLTTKEGRASLAAGIGEIKSKVGDVKLSDVQMMLTDEKSEKEIAAELQEVLNKAEKEEAELDKVATAVEK